MLTVPEPLPNDPEGVQTALETAEIFGKQGDLKEAVRWVRRAAEIAGDEGIDERALTLARAVADLNISASQPPQQPKPMPKPPLPAAGAATDDPDADAETRVVDSARVLDEYEKQKGSNGAAAAAAADATVTAVTAVLPADEAPEPLPPPPPVPAAAARPVEAPPPPSSYSDESTPISRRGIGSMAELLARKEAEVSSARAAAEAAMPADTTWDDPPPPPPQPSTPPAVERRTARPSGERIPTPLIPAAPFTDRPPLNAPVHQAVRASVVATAEPGVFVLRVLTADQPPAPTAHEVLVVVTNPSSSPFK